MSLPSGYLELEYIQSSGTQYINTGFKPNQDTKIDFVVSNISTTGSQWLSDVLGQNYEYGVVRKSDNKIRFYYETSGADSTNTYNQLGKYEFITDKNSLSIYYEDEFIETITKNYLAFQLEYKLPIFARNSVGTITKFAFKLHSYKLYDNETLIRDFVPSIRRSDWAIGLYDKVNNQFYTNSGSGTFIAGKVVDGKENIIFTNNPLSLTINEDTELTANFKKAGGIKYLIGV